MKKEKWSEISEMAIAYAILIGGILLVFAFVIGYAYAVQKYNEEAPIKTSVVSQKRQEVVGITIAPNQSVGLGLGTTSGNVYLTLENGDKPKINTDTVSIGDTVTYKGFKVISVNKK